MSFVIFVALAAIAGYGEFNDFPIAIAAWGGAIAVAFSMANWFGWAAAICGGLALVSMEM